MPFADAGFLIAIVQPRDSLHRRAHAWLKSLRGRQLVVTEHVLWETVNALSEALPLRADLHRLVDAILTNASSFRFVPASEELLELGLAKHRRCSDKEWGLTDCISFAVMEAEGIRDALAYDHHFIQAGFNALLRADPPQTHRNGSP